MYFPSDIKESIWNPDNYKLWSASIVTQTDSIQLQPLEAKALHVIGTLVQIFEAAGHLLYCDPQQNKPFADYSRYAYLLACTAIELVGRCWNGKQNVQDSTLEAGLRIVGLEKVDVNVFDKGKPAIYTYDITKLVALRNLIAHGQGVASANRTSQQVILHVELLDGFPIKLAKAFDNYYEGLFKSPQRRLREKLAEASVEPTLYPAHSGQIYQSPITEAHGRIYKPGLKPSEVLRFMDWQIYNPRRDE